MQPGLFDEARLTTRSVHYAGNLQIAAAIFVSLGLCMTLALSLITMRLAVRPSKRSSSPAEVSTATVDDLAEQNSLQSPYSKHLPHTPYVVAVLLACLYIGAVTQVLAQYFGVLGLTVNATPNADTAVGTVHDSDYNHFVADSWAVGQGLSTYATIAWTSALSCAAVATLVLRTPRFAKLL